MSTTSAGFEVLALEIPHKGGRTFGYRVSDGRSAIAYLSDHGPSRSGRAPTAGGRTTRPRSRWRPASTCSIHDAQHTAEELPARCRWGHSAIDYPVRLGELAGAKAVLLFHHDPIRTDDELDAIVAAFADAPVPVTAAAEGTTIDLYKVCRRNRIPRVRRRRIQLPGQEGEHVGRSSICFVAGLPWPWPAVTSTRRSTTSVDAAWSRAANLRAWHGSTRLSSSPVVTSRAG